MFVFISAAVENSIYLSTNTMGFTSHACYACSVFLSITGIINTSFPGPLKFR